MRYKETKCEMETMNGKLTEAYSKIKFLELEVVQAITIILKYIMSRLQKFIDLK